MVIIGYSGHAFVACGILKAAGTQVKAYCDVEEKKKNPFGLLYLGNERSQPAIDQIRESGFFIGIGENLIRKKIFDLFASLKLYPVNAIHPSAIIDSTATISKQGIMIGANVCINPLSEIGMGAICNTGSIIEHECIIGGFAHIGPGAVVCGNVYVGDGSFIGAASVIRQGVRIGNNAVIGAGAVVVKDVKDNETVVGNPSRILVK
jgi:sugar O-acyltransferase (sialic acid O-acetyltransferase NeuD family)